MFRRALRLVAFLFVCAAAPVAFGQTAPSAPATSSGQAAPTVVIVVRHAEKAAVEGNDPPLSEAGQKRAERLAALAAEAGVAALYTTQFKRTRETARPAAEQLKLTPVVVEVTRENAPTHAADLAREILAKQKGKTVLVVGHSNTAPQVAGALSGRTLAPLDDATDFETLFVVVIPESGSPRLVRAKY
jgi:broad specificity phosphatase PhoE